MRVLTFSCLLVLLSILAGCGDDGAPGTCPTYPAVGESCSNAGLMCSFGGPPCGGATIACQDGAWVMTSHTLASPACSDSGVVDAGSDASADAATDASSDAGSVTCGDTRCGPSEYCFIMCTCCGIPDAGPPSSTSECRPLPAGCSADALCSCSELTSTGNCDEAARSIDQPCA